MNRLGLIDYKPGTDLTKGQKGWVTKKAKEYHELLAHPERFSVRNVSKDTAKSMKKAGVKVSKTNRAIIALKGFDSVKVKGASLEFNGTNKKTGAKVKESVSLIGSSNFESRIKALSKIKLKKNQTLSVKIGNSATINTGFQNVKDLIQYVNTIKFNLKRGQSTADVLRQISIVEITTSKPHAKKTKK